MNVETIVTRTFGGFMCEYKHILGLTEKHNLAKNLL